MDIKSYDFTNTNSAEQFNTLLLVDSVLGRKLDFQPTFHILGGTALLFHGIGSVATIDIDIANTLSPEVRDLVDPLISDGASEVATLPKFYEKRLQPFGNSTFNNIIVYLLSLEDIAITKLGAYRYKDREDLSKTSLLEKCDLTVLRHIIVSELDTPTATVVRERLNELI